MCRELEGRGLDPAPVLLRHQVDRATFHALTGKLPAEQVVAVAEDLIVLARDPRLGLYAGLRTDLADFGLFGLLIRSSQDLRTAVQHYLRYNDQRPGTRVFNTEVELVPNGALLRYLHVDGMPVPPFVHDIFAAVLVEMVRQTLGLAPAWVDLALERPDRAELYQELLGVPVRFGMPCTQLLVPTDALPQGFPHGDGEVVRLLEPHVVGAPSSRAGRPGQLVSRVQALLLTAPGTPPPTMTQVAERLATSERTLRRHLLAAGTTFHDLLDETRRRTAVETVMTMPEVTGAELAARLGYTDPPAFYRAFKRWTGMSLTQYRIRLCTPEGDRTARPTTA